MGNIGRVAVVIAAILAIFIGVKYAKETIEIENTHVKVENLKEAEWVRVDGNGNVIPPAGSAAGSKAGSVEKVKEAKWVKVEGNGYVTSYADPSTIIKADDKVKMLALVDFKTVIKNGGNPYMSTKTQHEYDCKEVRWRMLEFSYHSGNMGEGELVFTDAKPGNWEPVLPGSGTQVRWKIACGKN